MMIARRVLGGLDSVAESSLSDDESEADSKGLIRAPHHCKSIFHLKKIIHEKFVVNSWLFVLKKTYSCREIRVLPPFQQNNSQILKFVIEKETKRYRFSRLTRLISSFKQKSVKSDKSVAQRKFSNSRIRDRKRTLLDQDLATVVDIEAGTWWIVETTSVQRAPTSSITINP